MLLGLASVLSSGFAARSFSSIGTEGSEGSTGLGVGFLATGVAPLTIIEVALSSSKQHRQVINGKEVEKKKKETKARKARKARKEKKKEKKRKGTNRKIKQMVNKFEESTMNLPPIESANFGKRVGFLSFTVIIFEGSVAANSASSSDGVALGGTTPAISLSDIPPTVVFDDTLLLLLSGVVFIERPFGVVAGVDEEDECFLGLPSLALTDVSSSCGFRLSILSRELCKGVTTIVPALMETASPTTPFAESASS